MKDRKIFTYLCVAFAFALALFMLFKANTQSFKSLSASVSPEEEKNLILDKSKEYIQNNINKYDGESEITLKELIINDYFTEEETKEVTKDLYDEDTRIYFVVKDSKIEDIYLKNELFSKLFRCSEICYINDENNYIYYNNDTYRIIKVDSSGSVYITNNEVKEINTDNIVQVIRNKYSELDKKISNTVDLISQNDINNSNFINPEKDMMVSSSTGYKIYDNINNTTRDIDVSKADIIFVIKLLNTVNYKMGDGSKFDPYIVTE